MEAIIVGVGMAGATTAISLTKLGIKCVVYESAKELKPVGAAVTIGPNGLRMIEKYIDSDLFKEIYAEGNHLDNMAMINKNNDLLVKRKLGLEAFYGYHMVSFQRPHLQEILVNNLKKLNVEIRYGKRLKNIAQENNKAKVEFEDGSFAEGDFVVSCDGIHSKTRQVLFGSNTENSSGLTAVLGISKSVDWSNSDAKATMSSNTFYMVSDYELHMVCIPQIQNKYFWSYGFKGNLKGKGWRELDINKDVPEFGKTLKEKWADNSAVKKLVSQTDKCTAVTLDEVSPLNTWHSKRVALLGDAAHAITPHMGQGLNMAFEDVAQLTLCFKPYLKNKGTVLTSDELENVFIEYEKHRIPRTTFISNQTKKIANASISTNRIIHFIRDLMGRLAIFILGPRMFSSSFSYDIK